MNTGLNFQVAINYGSRDEIIRAVKTLSKDVKENRLALDDINEDLFSQYLDTKGIPEPDLLIRTSGEQRLSNFLLWQMAYTEFYFTDVLWPDFNKEELLKAIQYYSQRNRKFGGIS
jgi:undecaprenyl diphosphate synthase